MNAILGMMVVLLSGAAPKAKPFDSKPDAFHVDFPGAPKTETLKDKDKDLVTRTYTVDNEFGIYLVIVMNDADITPDNPKESFDSFRDSEKDGAKIVSEKPLTLGAYPGLELKTKGKDMDSIARMYVGKGRAWTLVVDADHGHSFAELGADAFFASFSITDKTAVAAAPPPPPVAKTPPPPAEDGALSPDGVELLGWTPDGAKVVAIEHGMYDGKGSFWARATFFDTAKGAAMGKPLEVELEGDSSEAAAVAEMKKRAEAERVRLKLPPLVRGKVIKTDEKGALTGADGSPTGNLEIKSRKAKGNCSEPFTGELLTLRLFLMGDDKPLTVLSEKKPPASRACSMGCTASATYGQEKAALFVLKCQVRGFEGPATQPMLVPFGKLEFPLEADLPQQ